MNELAWLVGHRFQSLARRDYEWVASFDSDARLVIACLWRLVESGRVRFTSEDDGHQFGLPAPVAAAAEVNGRLGGAAVVSVELRQGLLDLELRFSTDTRFKSFLIHRGMRRGMLLRGTSSSSRLAGVNWPSSATRPTLAAANQRLKLTGAAILVFRASTSLPAAPAA
jgi:hypothetical protein